MNVLALVATDADSAREEARRILEKQPFAEERPPGVLEPVSEFLGDIFAPILDGIGWVLERLDGSSSDGGGGGGISEILFLLLIVALVAVVAALIARTLEVRHSRRQRRKKKESESLRALDSPQALERQADLALQQGDLEGALRLLFRAGVLRLQDRQLIPAGSAITTRQIARTLRRKEFDRVALRFDEVVYGRREAQLADVDESRTVWRSVVGERGAS